jgi:NAD(P)-dependent dehydrogenase (short-subunit alcohol dehydrogenase family)
MDAGREDGGDGVRIDLTGKTAIVVGASEGIGAAIALGLAHAGARLVLGGRDRERMAATLAAVRAQGGIAEFEAVDVREPEAIRAFA